MAYRKKKRPEGFCSTKMKKELILKRLREKKYRITKQRQMLLDVILQEECASCKEIYYKAKKEDSSIGAATVYRMINLLEEIGAIRRENACVIELDDHTVFCLSAQRCFMVVLEGLRACGYADEQQIVSITLEPFLKNDP